MNLASYLRCLRLASRIRERHTLRAELKSDLLALHIRKTTNSANPAFMEKADEHSKAVRSGAFGYR